MRRGTIDPMDWTESTHKKPCACHPNILVGPPTQLGALLRRVSIQEEEYTPDKLLK